MKQCIRYSSGLTWILIISVCLLGVSCSTDTKTVDVVNEVLPVSTSYIGIAPTLNELASLPPEERSARLAQSWPNLSTGILYYARIHGLIPKSARIDRIELRFGSLDHVRANDGAGAGHEGHFTNQLVARVYVTDKSAPVDLIILCLNGMSVVNAEDWNKLQTLSTPPPIESFRIGKREGLIHHVDFPMAIDLAEKFGLPLYTSQVMDSKHRITPEQARRMEPLTARTQVSVRVYEGDKFDLVAGTYTPAKRFK